MRSGQGTRVETSQMSSSVGVQRSPVIQDSFSSARAPDFKARAEAKKAWLARRSAPRKGLFLGLLAGGAIGCLSAFAVMSVIPNEVPAPAAADGRAATIPSARPANDAAGVKVVTDGSTPERRELRQISTDRVATPAPVAAPPPIPAVSPATGAPVPAAVTRGTPPSGVARTELSANAKPAATPVVQAAIPEAPTAAAGEPAAPVLAQTDTAEQKPKAVEKKRKKKQTAKQRNRPQPNQWAPPDNFFFGGDRMARSF